jgi:RNA polymerase sigma factor (sigma-70 family)
MLDLGADDPDDAELVARSRRRDCDAFGALVERHHPLVFGVALARTQDVALAEDVAQEAFVAAWRDLERLRDGDRVGTWVAGIARNLAASAARTRARRRASGVPEAAGTAPSPEDAALAREERELLDRALADLPTAHRDAIVQHYLEGQPVARIAAAAGVSEDVIKQRLSRGRRGLRLGVASRVDAALVRASVVAAITATGIHTTNAAGTAAGVMTMANKAMIAAVAAAAVGGGALLYATRGDGAPARAPAGAPAPTATATAVEPATATASKPAGPTPRVRRLADPADRERLLAAIRTARDRRIASRNAAAAAAAAAPATPTPAPAADGDGTDSLYITTALNDIQPLMAQCYDSARERDPYITGAIRLDFTVEGEAEIGGLVTHNEIVEDGTTVTDPEMRECLHETMYALEMPPPSSGQLRIDYTFAFTHVRGGAEAEAKKAAGK